MKIHHTFTVTTANIPDGADADYQYLTGSVILTQENGRRDAKRCVHPRYLTFQFPHPQDATVIHLDGTIWHRATPTAFLLNAANGLTFPSARRYATMVRTQHRHTGRWATFGCFHFVPHADDAYGGVTKYPRGRKAVTPAITTLVSKFPPSLVGCEIIGGDFNIDYDRDLTHKDPTDLLERLNGLGFVQSNQVLGNTVDTHGSNEYDWIAARLPWHTKMIDQVVHPKRKSDHRAKTVMFSQRSR